MLKTITSRAPTRIDLAGGTLDLWPIYLMVPEAKTINLSIDLIAETTLTPRPDSRITLRSRDQNQEITVPLSELNTYAPHPQLELHTKLLNHIFSAHPPETGFTLETFAQSPSGAGLGGSSTLSISLLGALETFRDGLTETPVNERLTKIARDVESTVIKVPAGLQDYYGALYGGLQVLTWGVAQHNHERLLDPIREFVAKDLILFYSGKSRNSGINNWSVYKSYLDQDHKMIECLHEIASATKQVEEALRSLDTKKLSLAIQAEWRARKRLALGITTDEIDQALALAATKGALAGKVCGAGGGGCFFVYAPELDQSAKQVLVSEVIAIEGIRHLPFHSTEKGLEVSTT